MAYGDSPYDYLSPEFRPVLDDALDQVPEARRQFDLGKVPRAREALDGAGFTKVAWQLDLCMPNKFSG